MNNEDVKEDAESYDALDAAQLEVIRNRVNAMREVLVHAAAMRVAATSLCDRLCNFGMATNEIEAEELFNEIQTAWATSKASFRLLDLALSGA